MKGHTKLIDSASDGMCGLVKIEDGAGRVETVRWSVSDLSEIQSRSAAITVAGERLLARADEPVPHARKCSWCDGWMSYADLQLHRRGATTTHTICENCVEETGLPLVDLLEMKR